MFFFFRKTACPHSPSSILSRENPAAELLLLGTNLGFDSKEFEHGVA